MQNPMALKWAQESRRLADCSAGLAIEKDVEPPSRNCAGGEFASASDTLTLFGLLTESLRAFTLYAQQ